jgi:general secretion pathway protein E
VLRQDPDIILIGEIRDAETAQIAVQAAITGHLVLASLHANNAAMAVTRMIDLGVDPVTLAASLRGVTAQRLVRRIAGAPVYQAPNEAELAWLRQHGMRFKQPPRFATPPQPMAYQGNVPVIEFIVVDAGVRRAATDNAGAQAIYAAASLQPQFETLAQAGSRLALEGHTSLSEVRRITSDVDVVAAGESRLGNILVWLGVVNTTEVTEAIAHVIHQRQAGRVLRLGEALVQLAYCTPAELLNGMGQSPAARGIAETLMDKAVVAREAGLEIIQDWRSGGGSLFGMMVEAGLCDWEDIHAATGIPAGD